MCVDMCVRVVCVFVCGHVRERERERMSNAHKYALVPMCLHVLIWMEGGGGGGFSRNVL